MSTTDSRSLELLVALLRQASEAAPEEPPDPRRRTAGWIALAAFSVALLVPIVLVAVAIAPKLPASGPAAPSPAGATSAGSAARPSAGHPAPAPAAVEARPRTMPPAALALTRAELAGLAVRLPTRISLTAPAGWARRGGAIGTDATPGASCPQVFGWIGNRLGGDWTYAYGALPQGSCSWAPAPFRSQQPTPDRFLVKIGFERGDVRALLGRPARCTGDVAAPRLPVPAVAKGAVLTGCEDGVWPSVELRLPDAGGTGVWFLSSVSGANQHTFAPSDGLLAALDGATHAYS